MLDWGLSWGEVEIGGIRQSNKCIFKSWLFLSPLASFYIPWERIVLLLAFSRRILVEGYITSVLRLAFLLVNMCGVQVSFCGQNANVSFTLSLTHSLSCWQLLSIILNITEVTECPLKVLQNS